MKVFVTGGSGLVGQDLVPQLIAAGHQVAALARSDTAATKLTKLGATTIVNGSLDDVDTLSRAASNSDAVIHAGFDHSLAFAGAMDQALTKDRQIIAAMCDALLASSSDKATPKTFVYTSGTLGNAGPDETDGKIPQPGRSDSEIAVLAYAKKGLHAVVVQLPPVVHGPDRIHPFIGFQIDQARKLGYVSYVGDGSHVWPAGHVQDVASLMVLALDKAPSGTLHANTEVGIPLKDIATFIAKKLKLETRSVAAEDLQQFGFIGAVLGMGGKANNKLTKQWTGWQPSGASLFEEMEQNYGL